MIINEGKINCNFEKAMKANRWESDGYGGLIFLVHAENAKGELDWIEPYGNDFWDGFCEGEVPAGW